MEETIYTEAGYLDREEYLETLADEYGIEIETVLQLADFLGEQEDFDGLIVELEDTIEY
jgi:hypothetical protein